MRHSLYWHQQFCFITSIHCPPNLPFLLFFPLPALNLCRGCQRGVLSGCCTRSGLAALMNPFFPCACWRPLVLPQAEGGAAVGRLCWCWTKQWMHFSRLLNCICMWRFKPCAVLYCPQSKTGVTWEPSFPLCPWHFTVLLLQYHFWCPPPRCLARWMQALSFSRVSSASSSVVSNQRVSTLSSPQITGLHCKYFVRKTEILHKYSCLGYSDSS